MTSPVPATLDLPDAPGSDLAREAVARAESLLRDSLAQTTRAEAAQMRQLAGLIDDLETKAFTLQMTDGMGRSQDAARLARWWRRRSEKVRAGAGFSTADRWMLRAGVLASHLFPGLVMRAVQRRLRTESRSVILGAEDEALTRLLRARRASGAKVNLNQLGEAVLSEAEAGHRMEALLGLIARPDVDYVSVKISAIFSQIHLVAWMHTLEAIKDRLRVLYRAALQHGVFVNLDMEEYRDLELTVRAFREVLDEAEFRGFYAGMVLQAYLPDSSGVQRELTAWAQARVSAGGSPIKVRLVKGANLAMEQVEAELHGWNAAPHRSKADTDASFRRMLEFACQPEHLAAVRIGVGSHNLFDVALALVLRARSHAEAWVEIEMLEGMAPAQSRVVRDAAGGVLFYAPIVHEKDYGSALAYLIRRLDENTAPGNFLASLFSLRPGSAAWTEQRNRFLEGWARRQDVASHSYRRELPARAADHFSNEPDTDWTQPALRERWQNAQACTLLPTPAGAAEIEHALVVAEAARAGWASRPEAERAAILQACAEQLAQTRFETIALLRDEGKKAATEADTEVSEAIDFARDYAETGRIELGLSARPLGTVVVAPPWNFPFAIPCGGVLAALMAGNTVILKPAPEAVRVGAWLVRQLWAAGVPHDVLHCVVCADGEVGRTLITDTRTSAVILTGAFATARRFQAWRPALKLFAETSGKNAIVVSALADRELAVKDIVRSAFGHAGQKCSAASLAILEAEVYDDEVFRRQLRDAAASLEVGPAADAWNVVTPLVQAPGEDLRRALTTLEPGEQWLLEPRVSADDPCLWSPGIKIGVQPDSWFHRTECFGPVLGVMRATDLAHAITLQNATAFGLTAGFHSLDATEIAAWQEQVQAGNLYINRGITGAIVRRQPFGGWKRSSIGPGAKAGGPNYVNLFRTFQETAADVSAETEARRSYETAWTTHFAVEHDPSGLRCERNVFRYRPCRGVLLRLKAPDATIEGRARLAAQITGVPLTISWATTESDEALAQRLATVKDRVEFVRTVDGAPGEVLLRAMAEHDLNGIDAPLSASGRLELTRWLREQAVSQTLHRYGNIPPTESTLAKQ